jgi:hypothetical protein
LATLYDCASISACFSLSGFLRSYNGIDMVINNNQMGKITTFLYNKITGIQLGKEEDTFGWINKIN